MRAVYLIRHGEPEFKDNRKYCLGRMDLPLSEKGVLQAERLRSFIGSIPDKVIVSGPLKRAADTCRLAGAERFEILECFTEISTGEWDGLAFDDIKTLYPAEYRARGKDLYNTAPPGGESFAECYERVSAGMKKLLKDHPAGNICIFTHEGVMKMLTAFLTGVSGADLLSERFPYGSALCFLLDGRDAYRGPAADAEKACTQIPDEAECERLLEEYGTPEHVREHCRAVSAEALKMCSQLNENGAGLCEAAVRAGALLHDIARTEKDHAREGALWLNSRGFTAAAAIAGDHMTLPAEEERISEKSLVFLADKYVKGTEKVTLHQRYFPEGLADDQRPFHEVKYVQAEKIRRMISKQMENRTLSVCPVCLKTIPAVRVKEKQNIYLEKTCPEHGPFRTLVWEGTPTYETWGEKRPATRKRTEERVSRGCPNDCGLCGHHRQRTCCVLLEVTHRCDLNCPVCFADSGREETDPDLSVISGWYDIIKRDAPGANIQLSGGEPTMRDDLEEIIRIGRDKGFTYFQLNTNGLRIARDPEYLKRLKAAGLNCVFLQFDGLWDSTYKAFRGKPLFEEKLRAILNCGEAGIGVVLVPVVAAGVNLDEVGDIIRFAVDHLPVVRGVHFQPISYFGRYGGKFDGETDERLTLPRLLREIEQQTGGMIKASYFAGGSAENPYCSFNGDFLLEANGSVCPLKTNACGCGAEDTDRERYSQNAVTESCGCGVPADTDDGSCGCGKPADTETECGCCGSSGNDRYLTAVEHTRDMVAKRWGAPVSPKEEEPEDPDSMDGLIFRLKNRRFAISAMAFMDCWSLDLERLQDCYINIMSPDGRLMPFCSYNLTSADGRPLHRT